MTKRYYTFMIDPELFDALKAAKETTGLSEGALIRQALKAWFAEHDIAVKSARKRVRPRKRA